MGGRDASPPRLGQTCTRRPTQSPWLMWRPLSEPLITHADHMTWSLDISIATCRLTSSVEDKTVGTRSGQGKTDVSFGKLCQFNDNIWNREIAVFRVCLYRQMDSHDNDQMTILLAMLQFMRLSAKPQWFGPISIPRGSTCSMWYVMNGYWQMVYLITCNIYF